MKKLLLIFLFSFILFSPSLLGFYTHDDFFHLKIAHAENFSDFVNFFNLTQGSDGQLLYRPLTTHVFYFLGWALFGLNPIGLHLVSFVLFFIMVYYVYKIIYSLSKNEDIALLSTFLYATSATHFGHLYYLATENVLGAFFFPAAYYFLRFLEIRRLKYYLWTFVFLILALLAKENSVVLPAVFGICYLYTCYTNKAKFDFKQITLWLIPFVFAILVYLYFHFFYYGFVEGDTYNWNFSPVKLLNTIVWYLAWSLNLPEMFLDFVGPGLRVNPNLFAFWGTYAAPIIILFLIQAGYLINIVKRMITKSGFFRELLFSLSWFVVTLSPIIFLPEHKFSFYLTLPLLSVVYLIALLLQQVGNRSKYLFVTLWIVTSVITLILSYKTNWITQGEKVARRAYQYFTLNLEDIKDKDIYFVDTDNDSVLPWSPTSVVRTTLSERNFFYVFFPQLATRVNYIGENNLPEKASAYTIESRKFLGY